MYIAEVEDVWKIYRVGKVEYPALRGVTLYIPKGLFIVILGPSGSGKSTLLHLIGALDTPTKGRIIVDGKDVRKLTEKGRARLRRDTIGFVFQQFYLIPRLTALENVEVPMLIKGIPRSLRKKRALMLLERVGLKGKEHKRPTELSGGEQQRVAIARALANDPKLILADEPTGNLDTATAEKIMELLVELNNAGKTVVVVTHNPEHAKYAHMVVRIKDGKIVEVREGGRPSPFKPEELLSKRR